MEENTKVKVRIVIRIVLTMFVLGAILPVGFILTLMQPSSHYSVPAHIIGFIYFPIVLLPLIWSKNKKKGLIWLLIVTIICGAIIGADYGKFYKEKKLEVNTNVNINVNEYLPFAENSKIVKFENSSLKLTDDLPRLDGAAAVFPVYSAFVHAVYPENVELSRYDDTGAFNYNNTVMGYKYLAERKIDIFFGAYPSDEQIQNAKEQGTTFEYIPIGYEAFVFFVNKDCPVDNLTIDQIKGIYSGEITNWKEVGGKDLPIVAYQRNEGSGSQSMLERFMDDTPIMRAPTEQKQDLMVGIIDVVSTYKNTSNAIGFSFRYYLDTLVANPEVKMLSVNGVYPSKENIKSGAYPIVGYLYAVTYAERTNPNVDVLLDWILSDEGQYIIDETGYVGVY